MNTDKPLNKKQILFCEEYIKTLNATKSYLTVYGCTQKTAEVNGCRLLSNARIQNYIEERYKNVEKSKIADANEVLEYFTRVMRGEEKDTLGFDASLKDRNKAGELLAKRYKLFEDKKEKEKEKEEQLTPKISIEVVDNSELEAIMYEKRNKNI